MKKIQILAIILTTVLLNACADVAPDVVPGASADTGALRAAETGRIVLRIKVPKLHRAHGKRDPRYVSAATKSITLKIAGPTKVTQTANLTATSKGCTSTVTGTLCQLTLTLKPGSYTATVSTFDAVNGAGNLLSTAQSIAFKVAAGASNAIGLTLSGVPHAILVAPASGYSRTGAAGEIELFGTAANRLLVEAMDADGNAIVGAGSPAFVVTKAFGALAIAIGQPTAQQPGIFTVTPPSIYFNSSATISVQAVYSGTTNACAEPGATCSGNAQIVMAQLGAVARGTSVSVFQVGEAAPFAAVPGLTRADAVAFDPAGNLYVTGASGVIVFAPPYASASFTISSGMVDPKAMAFDSLGDLFVADCPSCFGAIGDAVRKYVPPFSSTSAPALTLTTGISRPVALLEDTGNNLYVANFTGNAGAGSVTEYTFGALSATITNTVAAPNALAFDAAIPALFVSNSTGTVEQYGPPFNGAAPAGSLPTTSPGGTVATYCGATGTPLIDHPVALAIDSGGSRIFVASSSAGAVNAVVSFSDTTFACRGLFGAGGNPDALAVDGTPRLYAANASADSVTIYNGLTSRPPTLLSTLSASTPAGLAIAP